MYACCSVLPSRVESPVFASSVKKLASYAEISQIYIFYPKHCRRLDIAYPEVPVWMKQTQKVNVVSCEDMGPATKFLSLLDMVPQNQLYGVLLFDDDRMYPEGWWEPLIESYKQHKGESAVGRHGSLKVYDCFSYSTWNFSGDEEAFLSMKTTFGVIYPRKALPSCTAEAVEFIQKYKKYGSENNDDMMLAAWCFKNDTKIYIIPTKKEDFSTWEIKNANENDAASLCLKPRHVQKQLELASKMMFEGDFPVPWVDIAAYVAIGILIIALIVFIVFIIIS